MDSKIVFFRTDKGENEVQCRQMHLSVDYKRLLLMVDGTATIGEISRRLAPSPHNAIDEIFKELERDGFIQNKAKPGNTTGTAILPIKSADDGFGELDFTVEFRALSADTPKEESRKAEHSRGRTELEAEKAETVLLAPAQLQGRMPGETARQKPGSVAAARSTSVTVLFFDVVGYTKQPVNKQIEIKKQFNQLVTDCLSTLEDGERIILDTGDGAAIGFLQHPEDALKVAKQFRGTVIANQHKDYPDLNVRIGIHLGPINVVKDINGQSNMVGDGINDAQRVMSFAGVDQVYISRPYHDFISRLSDEYASLFQYRGIQKDKHEREHQIYELVDAMAPVTEILSRQISELPSNVKLEPFSLTITEVAVLPAPAQDASQAETRQDELLLGDFAQFSLPAELPRQAEPPAEKMPGVPTAGQVAEAVIPHVEGVSRPAETQTTACAEALKSNVEAANAHSRAPEIPRINKGVPAAPLLPENRGQRIESSKYVSRPPWGKLGLGLFILLLIALFVVPFLLPMQGYATSIENLLTARLQQPVHIGYLTGRLLPAPRLEFKDISIGEAKPIQVQLAQVDFALSALFSSKKQVSGIELKGVQVNGAALPVVSTWLQKIASDPQFPVARIGLEHGKLEADGLQLSGIGGELGFNQAGEFILAKLYAEENKLTLEIDARQKNKMLVSIALHNGALPLLPNWIFDELTAKGELTSEGLAIADLDGRTMGGVLLGDASIDWRSGWLAQGTVTTKNIALQNISQTLSGDLDGTVRFQMQSGNLSSLMETAKLEGTFVARKGVIHGIDVVETARQRSMISLAGGRTHFDELSGELFYAQGDYRFRKIKMGAGVLNATGSLDIVKQQLSGNIAADLTKLAGMGTVALQVGGTTDKPALRATR